MPAATQSAGTEKFTDFEERRYTVRVVSCEDTTSPPPDNRPQYKWEMALEGSEDPETGAEMVRRMWCSTVWNDRPEKESHLVLIARALIGPSVTYEQWEALGFADLVGLRGSALVALDPKGYPAIDKTTFRAVGKKAKGADVAAQSVAAGPTNARPLPPRPGGAPVRRSDEQSETILKLAREQEIAPDALDEWIGGYFPGKALDALNPAEAAEIIEQLKIPF